MRKTLSIQYVTMILRHLRPSGGRYDICRAIYEGWDHDKFPLMDIGISGTCSIFAPVPRRCHPYYGARIPEEAALDSTID